MSSLSPYDRDHSYNCPICRPKPATHYLGRYESYLSLIKSELSMLALPYQSKLNLEQTIEDVLYSIYSSKPNPEPVAATDYRSQEKLVNLEKNYSSLLYDYEKERNFRLELENELSSLQSRVIHLTQATQDCSEKHVSVLKVTDLNSEVELLRRRLQDVIQENHELRSQKKINEELKNNHRDLQGEVDKKDRRISQVLQDLAHYKDLYHNFRDGYSKESTSLIQRYEKVVQEKADLEDQLREVKEKYKRLAKKYSDKTQEVNESNTVTFKPRESLRNGKSVKSEESEGYQRNKRSEMSERSDRFDRSDRSNSDERSYSNQRSDKNEASDRDQEAGYDSKKKYGARFREAGKKENNPNDKSGENSKKNPERDESPSNLKEYKYNTFNNGEEPAGYESKKKYGSRFRDPGKKTNTNERSEENFKSNPERDQSPANIKETGYNSFNNGKKSKKGKFEDNEYFTSSKNVSESPQRRQSKSRANTNISEYRRRSSEMTPGFATNIKRNGTNNSPARKTSYKAEVDSKPCEICVRRHGEAYFKSTGY